MGNITSYLPFINFLISFAGLILMFVGIIQMIAIRRQFSMYFEPRDQVPEDTHRQRRRKMITSIILFITGVILMVLSYIM